MVLPHDLLASFSSPFRHPGSPAISQHIMHIFLISFLLALCAISASGAPSLPPHPRLIVDDAALSRIQVYMSTNPDAASLYRLLLSHADWVATQPLTPYPSNADLVLVRNMLDVLLTSSLAYRLSHNASYLARALDEVMHVATTWTDFGPASFLCVAETSSALALAYDWLYYNLTTAQRAAVEASVTRNSLALYAAGYSNHTFFWFNDDMNWNCVCAGSGILASLAFGDAGNMTDFVWSAVFAPSVESLPYCVAGYDSEGSWMEGYSYATYMGKYWIYAAAALSTAQMGNVSAALNAIPGASVAGRFFVHEQSSSGSIFNWADEEETPCVVIGANYSTMTPFVMYFGSTFNDSIAAFDARQGTLAADTPSTLLNFQWGGYAEGLMFFTPIGGASDYADLPAGHWYPQRQVATFRTGWPFVEKPGSGALGNYLVVKGGNTAYTHSHADLGSFVYDSSFTRFVNDLGADNYDLPGYWGPQRYDYYRLSSRGHNVPIFSNMSQSTTAAASVVTANVTSAAVYSGVFVDGFLVLDLSAAYASNTSGIATVRRGVASLSNVSSVLVVDEFGFSNASAVANVTWRIHTNATVAVISPTTATLNRNGSSVTVDLLTSESSCDGAAFESDGVDLPPPQYSAAGVTRLTLVAGVSCTRVVVLIASAGGSLPVDAHVAPLADWLRTGPFTV